MSPCYCENCGIASCNANQLTEEKCAILRNANCCSHCGMHSHIARLCKKSHSFTCGSCQRDHLTILCKLSRPPEGHLLNAESAQLYRPLLQALRNATPAQSSYVGSTAGVVADRLYLWRIGRLTTPSSSTFGQWQSACLCLHRHGKDSLVHIRGRRRAIPQHRRRLQMTETTLH